MQYPKEKKTVKVSSKKVFTSCVTLNFIWTFEVIVLSTYTSIFIFYFWLLKSFFMKNYLLNASLSKLLCIPRNNYNYIFRLNYFDNVHGVLYIASLGGYNLVLEEEPTTNRMMESLKLFHTLTSSPIFAKTSFMLFLNKTDVFR